MSPVGHSLVGASVGVLCMPGYRTSWAKAAFLGCFVVLANAPDLPFPGWGHDQYRISHSLFVTAAAIAVLVAVLACGRSVRATFGGTRTILGGSIAWLSHPVLDSFYNHGRGIAVLWPFSDARLALPVPWFSTLQGCSPPQLNMYTLKVCSIEFLAYVPLLLIAGFCRYRFLRKQGRP